MTLSRAILFSVLFAVPAFAADPVPPAAPAAPVAEPAAPAASSVSLEGLAVGSAVVDRALQGAASSFSADESPRLYCYNKVMAADAPTTITHVWIKDGTERGTITLNIGANPWRTWSNHAVEPGSWKVEVRDASGSVIDSVAFTVTEGMGGAAPAAAPAATGGTGY